MTAIVFAPAVPADPVAEKAAAAQESSSSAPPASSAVKAPAVCPAVPACPMCSACPASPLGVTDLPPLHAPSLTYETNRYRLAPPYSDPDFVRGPVQPPRKAYFLALGEVLTIDLGIWAYDYLTGAPFAQITSQTISDNFHKGWIIDTDDFWANGFLHPLHGNLTYNAARSLGLNFYESFGMSFVGSYVWEQFLEIQPPSMNDMVNTPFGGTMLGEATFRLSRLILDSGGYAPGFWRQFFAFLINPIGGGNRAIFGDKYRGGLILPASWIGEFRFGSVVAGSDRVGATGETATKIGPWFSLSAHVLYNVPGTPGLVLEKPFDHFELEGSFAIGGSASAQPAGTLLIRGLLLGETLTLGDEPGGFWGLFTSYDFIAPEVFRVQGWGLGPGIALAKRWGWFELEGTFLGEILPWSGGGATKALGVRDYHYGPGGDVVIALRSLITDRVILRVEGREYWISGLYSSGQSENISYVRTEATVRIYDIHAVSATFDFSHREARYPFEPDIFDRASIFSLYYTILQGW